MSYHDGAKEEKFYHNLILGMLLYLDDKYSIKSNIEEGYGRTDVLMFPLNKKVNLGFIFEFKVSEKGDDESMEKAVNEALNQIKDNFYLNLEDKENQVKPVSIEKISIEKDKEYEIEMQQHKVKDILNLGIAFNGKKVKVKLG